MFRVGCSETRAVACCASWRVRRPRIASLPSVIDDLVVEAASEVPELFQFQSSAGEARRTRSTSPLRVLRDGDLACQQQSAEGKTQPERQTGIGGARTGISSETARPRRRLARRAHERFVQHPRGSECASRRLGFVQPPFRQLRGDENTNAARRVLGPLDDVDIDHQYRRAAAPASGHQAAARGAPGVALSRTIARCPSRERGELLDETVVPRFVVRGASDPYPFVRFRTRHVPPDESVAPGARVRGGLGGAHAPHRKQVRARPRNVVLPTRERGSRDASTLRLSPKESWHPSAPPNLRTRSDTRAPRRPFAGANLLRARTRPLQTCLGLVPGNVRRRAHARRAQRGFSASPASGDFGSWESLPRRLERTAGPLNGGAGGGRSDLSGQERPDGRRRRAARSAAESNGGVPMMEKRKSSTRRGPSADAGARRRDGNALRRADAGETRRRLFRVRAPNAIGGSARNDDRNQRTVRWRRVRSTRSLGNHHAQLLRVAPSAARAASRRAGRPRIANSGLPDATVRYFREVKRVERLYPWQRACLGLDGVFDHVQLGVLRADERWEIARLGHLADPAPALRPGLDRDHGPAASSACAANARMSWNACSARNPELRCAASSAAAAGGSHPPTAAAGCWCARPRSSTTS